MVYLQDKMKAETSEFEYGGTNSLDMFPVGDYDPRRVDAPTAITTTVKSVTFATESWANNNYRTFKTELNHNYESGTDVQPHIRILPLADGAGTMVFEFEWFRQRASTGETFAGATTQLSTTFGATDNTDEIISYVESNIVGTDFQDGDMLIGNLKRIGGTFTDGVALFEFGIHAPIGKVGRNFS